MNIRLTALGFDPKYTLDKLLLDQRGWVESRDFCRTIAAIDMILCKFPLHPYREVRLGTTPARYQDCAAMQEIVMLSTGLGMEFPELSTWACTDPLADEIIKLCSTGHEIETADSYAPYFMSLKMANRSKYSVTDNT